VEPQSAWRFASDFSVKRKNVQIQAESVGLLGKKVTPALDITDAQGVWMNLPFRPPTRHAIVTDFRQRRTPSVAARDL
jgi:hypothetical protein